MDLATYQSEAKKTMIPSDKLLERLLLRLTGEAGEAAETVKKAIRGDEINRDERLRQELGDVPWYTALIAEHVDADLSQIAEENLDKLRVRDEEEKIQGDGDER